ncbi:cDP-alcohol phosphatidyltransferase [Ruminococcus sp. CAG:382]|nr:cDP-alcohol phosphatidyltransferase [Ruminococcus sp. CAG:382]
MGKILDPFADKLMQFTAFVCLTIKNRFLLWLVILVAVKECSFLIGGIIIRKKENFVVASKWYGKMATFVITVCVCVLIVWWNIPTVTYVCAALSGAVMIFAFVMYIRYYYRQFFSNTQK